MLIERSPEPDPFKTLLLNIDISKGIGFSLNESLVVTKVIAVLLLFLTFKEFVSSETSALSNLLRK